MTKTYSNDYIIKRLIKSALFFLVIFMLLIVRLLYFGIVKKDEFETAVNKQNNFKLPFGTDRGYIFDRNNIPLTYRTKIPTIFVIKEALRIEKASGTSNYENSLNQFLIDLIKTLELNKEYNMTTEEYIEYLHKIHKDNYIEVPLIKTKNNKIIKSLDIDDINLVKGVLMLNKPIRYEDNKFLSHVLDNIDDNYDVILNFQSDLNNVTFTVDGQYRFKKTLQNINVDYRKKERSNSLKLTIDYKIQNIIEEIIDEKYIEGSKSAVIVTEVETGDIVGMVSRPYKTEKESKDYFNTAISGGYPPASLFKTVVLFAALESDIIDFHEVYSCKGFEVVGSKSQKCISYESGGHGEITISEAFADSCNSVFIQLGKKVGAQKIVEVAKRLGFGKVIDIGFKQEGNGNLPEGDSLLGPAIGNISIGQGDILVTPLQIANMLTIIANDGISKQLAIVDQFVTENGHFVKDVLRKEEERVIKYEHTKILKEMMEKVIDYGTAKNYVNLLEYGGAAGKTGTAQVSIGVALNEKVGWFSGYFPRKNPKYTITILLENESGGKSAGIMFNEIATDIIKLDEK